LSERRQNIRFFENPVPLSGTAVGYITNLSPELALGFKTLYY